MCLKGIKHAGKKIPKKQRGAFFSVIKHLHLLSFSLQSARYFSALTHTTQEKREAHRSCTLLGWTQDGEAAGDADVPAGHSVLTRGSSQAPLCLQCWDSFASPEQPLDTSVKLRQLNRFWLPNLFYHGGLSPCPDPCNSEHNSNSRYQLGECLNTGSSKPSFKLKKCLRHCSEMHSFLLVR